ncbi:unnamed protein product [Closterium sp. NIES-54]
MAAPLQTLHMDVWGGPARVSGQGHEHYFLLVVDDYTRYTTVFPLPSKGQVVDVLIPWIRAVRLQLRERFRADLPVLRLHSDRGGEFSSDLLHDFCRGEGILQSFTLPDSPQQNGIVERRIGLVMEVARTSMIHAATPHFMWPFAVRLISSNSSPMSPSRRPRLHCVGRGRLAMRRCSGSGVLVPLFAIRPWTSSPPTLFPVSSLALPLTRLAGSFTTPPCAVSSPLRTSRLMSRFPFTVFSPTALPLPRPRRSSLLQGPAPSGVSQVDPLLGTAPVEVAVGSGAARGAVSGGAASGGAEPRVAESEGAGFGGAEHGGEEPGGAKHAGEEPRGAEPEGVEPRGDESEGTESGGAEPQGAASSGGPAWGSPRLSPQQLREWLVQHARLWRGATGAGGAGATRAGGAGVTAGAGGTGGTAATSPGGARTRGTGAARTGGVGGAGAGDPTEPGAAGAGGSGAGGTGAGGAGAGGTGAGGAGAGGAGVGGTGVGGTGVGSTSAGGAGAGGAGVVDPGGTVRPRPYFVPLLEQVLGVPSSTSLTPPLLCPPPDQSQLPLQPASPLPAPSPYTEQSGGLTEHREPASRPVLPVCTARCVPRSHPPRVLGTHTMALRPSSVPLYLHLPAPPESSLPAIPDPESGRARATSPTISRLLATAITDPSFESAATSALVAELLDVAAAYRLDYATALVAESASASPPSVGGECALCTDVLEDRQEDFECLAAAVPRFASMLLAPEGDPDAPDIPTPRSYAEAITGPYSSQWQAAMDAEMAS